jgi:hypothetical protein
MIVRMAMTPGGGRSPSTKPPPAPPPPGTGRQPFDQRPRPPTRLAWFSMMRFGVLIGGLVIIVDLGTQILSQRALSPDDRVYAEMGDQIVNWILYSLLGIGVARATGLIYSGVLAGLLASVLDASVVAAAAALAPPIPGVASMGDLIVASFEMNVVDGTLFTAVSCVVYVLIQRWSAGQRRR